MKKLIERLIVFFIGLPLLLLVIVVFPQYNHLILNLLITVFSVLGALEFRSILAKKTEVISQGETIILGALGPAAGTLAVSFNFGSCTVAGFLILGFSWIMVSLIFSSLEKLKLYISKICSGFAVIIYPGFFIAWVIRMAELRNASIVILVFSLVTLLNDAFAWVFGMLFGNNNRGFLAASPNKSIAGFIGGFAASLFCGIGASLLFKEAFTSQVMPSALAGAILGLGSGAAAVFGDLAESAIKRSAGVKDSGTLILGRGGALDSIDSIALAAPAYYFLYQLLFQ